MTHVLYIIILRDIAHKAVWNGRLYKTDCGITTAVVPEDAIGAEPLGATYCSECYPV